MLLVYQAHLRESRGRGQPGLAEVARLGKVIQRLVDLINDDADPERHLFLYGDRRGTA